MNENQIRPETGGVRKFVLVVPSVHKHQSGTILYVCVLKSKYRHSLNLFNCTHFSRCLQLFDITAVTPEENTEEIDLKI